MKPIKLTDAELDAVFSAARPLDPDLSEKDVETLAAYEAGRRRIPMKHALTRTSATKFWSSQAMRSGEGTKADGR